MANLLNISSNEADSAKDSTLAEINQLKLLNQNIKCLQESLVNQRITTLQTEKIDTLIKQCNQLTESPNKSGDRLLKHSNFAAAQINPNDILPFSPITGEFNPVAPAIDVNYIEESGVVTAACNLGRCYEGPLNMVHGGTVAAIYDQILAMCGTCNQLAGPTASLTVEYHKPTPLNSDLFFHCRIVKTEGRKIFIEGECLANETVVSKAYGLFIQCQA